jgi:hypothetical protein
MSTTNFLREKFMLRLLLLLIVFATIDDAIAKETVMRTHISGLPRRVMRVHTKYTAIKSSKPRPKLRVDND